MNETKLEDLIAEEFDEIFHQLFAINAHSIEGFDICYLDPFNKLHRHHPLG